MMDDEDIDGGIIAYHGSPHDFEKFDTSKIGTGEGAQAYGHGLYFAGKEDVAKEYRRALTDTPGANVILNKDGSPFISSTDAEKRAARLLHTYEGNYDSLLEALNESDWNPEYVSALNKMRKSGVHYKSPGNMYEVHINAHPEKHFLDWDTPIRQQPHIMQAIDEHIGDPESVLSQLFGKEDPTGEAFFYELGGHRKPEAVSQKLSEMGLRGIRYLDANSRNIAPGLDPAHIESMIQRNREASSKASNPSEWRELEDDHKILTQRLEEAKAYANRSHNYVVFNHDHVNVRRKYEDGGRVGYDNGGEASHIPYNDPQYANNLKKFHGKTPDVIKNGKWLHGTDRDFQSFMRGPSGAIFVTQDPDFANRYAHSHWTPEQLQDAIESTRHFKTSEPMLNVMPVHVRAEKPFDFENRKHIAALYEELGPDLIMDPYLHKFMDEVREGHWGAIESSPIQNAIKAMGHDSFFVKENGVKNLGVYDPSQIKSATGNNGNFDMSETDITKSEGGALDDQSVDRLKMSHKDVTQRIPQLTEAAQKLGTDEMAPEMYQELVNKHKPVRPWEFVPEPATYEEIAGAVRQNQKPAVGKGHLIPKGHPVGLRLDIPAYKDYGVWAPTIHDKSGDKSTVLAHEPVAHISKAEFSIPENKALNVAKGTNKSPFATIDGNWEATDPEQIRAMAEQYLNHPEWSQVGMDPERHSYFYNRATQEPVTHADEVLQVGPLVLAKNARTMKPKAEFKYKSGGDVKQIRRPDRSVVDKALMVLSRKA